MRPEANPPVYVVTADGARAPMSKGLTGQSLTAIGLSTQAAWDVARQAKERLQEQDIYEITGAELHDVLEEVIAELVDEAAARRYRDWVTLTQADVPLIVLIAGASGTGKSTLATQLAHRFGINRVTSTDSIREVMRELSVRQMVPQLYYPSYSVPAPRGARPDDAVAGYLDQAYQVGIGVRAICARAVKEQTSMIIEGVHLHPDVLEGVDLDGCALVWVTLSVPNPQDHEAHFVLRDVQTGGRRPSADYLPQFPRIRAVHDYLVDEARKRGHEIIEASHGERTLPTLSDKIVAELRRVVEFNTPVDDRVV